MVFPRFSYEVNEEEKNRRHMVWEKGLLELMQKLQKGPKAIDKSTNSYQVFHKTKYLSTKILSQH